MLDVIIGAPNYIRYVLLLVWVPSYQNSCKVITIILVTMYFGEQ